MSQPYFEVGEEVIVCSEKFPESNGPAVVQRVFRTCIEAKIWFQTENNTSEYYECSEIGYLIDRPLVNHLGNLVSVSQPSLRKKHNPGNSFESLMSELKSPVKIGDPK